MFNDVLVKRLIKQYQEEGKGFEAIAEHISLYIYNYPRVVWKADEDMSSEFFIYFFERLENLLLKYKVFDCQFRTWLTVVLRMHFINWQKSKAKKHYIESSPVFLYSDNDRSSYVNDSDEKGRDVDVLRLRIEKLPRKVRVVMKLFYFESIEGKDFSDIIVAFKTNLSTLLARWTEVCLEVFERSKQREEYAVKVNELRHHLTEAKRKLQEGYHSQEKQQLLEHKIAKYEKQLNHFTKKTHKFDTLLSSSSISKFLGVSKNQVYALLHRGKLLLRKELTNLL